MAQVIEHQVCKGLPALEALNPEFNPNPTKVNLLMNII
jgi:hypothetical protein